MKTNLLKLVPKLFVIWMLGVALQACDNGPDPVVPVGTEGFYIVNEGAFKGSNASISFYDRNADKVINDIFTAKNGRPLGDQAQSIAFFENKAYIVVQNSSKIEVIDGTDYASLQTISTGLESPRYFLGVAQGKGYVTDWGADGITGSVKVINLETGVVTKSIKTGQGPNKIIKGIQDPGKVYVANSGGYGKDNKVTIINVNTDEIAGTITTGDNPNSLKFDSNGNLWVASSGFLVYNDDFTIDEKNSTKPTLSKFNSTLGEVFRLTFPNVTYLGATLESNPVGDQLYINYDGAVYKMAATATTLPTTPFINKMFYAIGMDTFTQHLVGCEAPSFSSPGKIYIYDENGTQLKSMEVGIAPNGITIKGF
ncbi:MAG TPA: YncE family protein [Cyclobacteriaceae bacterium]|nr:YncE family protein [Cyclobacteriaceae bacterium]